MNAEIWDPDYISFLKSSFTGGNAVCLHRKRPYEKPALTIISVDSTRYSELMQLLSQPQKNADDTKQSDDPYKKEEDVHV